jgi:hypothetical protein
MSNLPNKISDITFYLRRRHSLKKKLQEYDVPDFIINSLFVIFFVFILVPFFSGVDFGIFKVPQFHYPWYYLCATGIILSVLFLIQVFPSPLAVTLTFMVNKYVDAEQEYGLRQKELKEYSFEKSGFIMRRERRDYLDAPKRDYDEIFIEIKIENVGKRAIERFELSLENSEIGYDKSWSFKSGLANSTPLIPGRKIQFPQESVQLQIPFKLKAVDLKWSLLMDGTLTYTGKYQIRRQCTTET